MRTKSQITGHPHEELPPYQAYDSDAGPPPYQVDANDRALSLPGPWALQVRAFLETRHDALQIPMQAANETANQPGNAGPLEVGADVSCTGGKYRARQNDSSFT